MWTSAEPSIRGDRWRWLAAALAYLLLASLAVSPALAQPDPEAVRADADPAEDAPQEVDSPEETDLAGEIADLFRARQLRDGVLLEPRSEIEGVETIEVRDGTLAIDGRSVSVPEVREILGDVAEPVLRLFDSGAEGREALFDDVETRAEARERRAKRSKRTRHRSSQVVLGSSVTVDADEKVKEVVVLGGNVKVHGEVDGDAAAIGGSTWVDGEVHGSVIAVGGSVHLSPSAVVWRDVVSVGGRIHGRDEADIRGEVVEVAFTPSFGTGWWAGRHGWRWGDSDWFDFSPMAHVFGLAWDVFAFVVLLLLAFLAVLLAARPVDRIADKVAAEPWKAGLVGLLAQILFIPLLCLVVLILALSIVGIPLLLLVPFGVLAVVLVAFLGLVGVARQLGRWLEARFGWGLGNPYLAVLAGLAVLHVWGLIGQILDFGGPIRIFAFMFLAFGALVKYVAWTVGLGAALLTRAGTADGWKREPNGSGLPPLPEAGPELEPPAGVEAEPAEPEAEPDDEPR